MGIPVLGGTLPIVNPHTAGEAGKIAAGTEADVRAAARRRAPRLWLGRDLRRRSRRGPS